MSMKSSISMPQLPGYRKRDASPTKRVLDFNFVNGYSMQKGPVGRIARNNIKASASAGLLPLIKAEIVDNVSGFSPSPLGLSYPPSWLANDRQVLLFSAYFKEGVTESSDENYRVRKCEIFYYLADNTMHVAEPKITNSGIPQGIFMKRHKVPKVGGGFYSLSDLYIGANLQLYGRTLHIVDCNESTRVRMTELGYRLSETEEYPVDKYTVKKAKKMQLETGADDSIFRGVKMNDTKAFVETSLGRQIRDGNVIARYLKDDRKVLRFDCAWDTRDRLYGTINKYTFHYFLADDTIEILEKHTRNNGSANWPRLLNRAVLHKEPAPGVPETKKSIYTWKDFVFGAEIQCYGRNLILLDCDNFTREFYESQGVDLGQVIEMNLPERVIPTQAPPPHNSGIGSEEDSLGSCKSLLPKPPRKDIAKLLEMDRKILRFSAVFTNPLPEDKGRKFLINFFLADDTLSVGEPPIRNSGITGGQFLKRGKYIREDGSFLKFHDFRVGEEVQILKHSFKLTDADEYTLSYISKDASKEPETSEEKVASIIMKLTTKLRKEKFTLGKAFRIVDTNHSGMICLSELKNLLSQYFSNSEVSSKELLTIMRFFDDSGEGLISIHEFIKRLTETDVKQSSQEIGSGMGSGAIKIPALEPDYLERCQASDILDVGQHYKQRILFSFAGILKNRGIGLQKVFNVLDKDGSGVLEKDEFKKILMNSDIIPGNMPMEQIDVLTDYFVGDTTGILDLKEFRNKLLNVFMEFEKKEMSRIMHRQAGDTSF